MSDIHRKHFILAFTILFLAVLFGAFGAHGLSDKLSLKLLTTYKTGITYQFYHGFALMIILTIKLIIPKLNIKHTVNLFLLGIVLFSFNCYLYALTSQKVFAIIVPFGGMSFLLGWLILIINFSKVQK
jgi:uncharacterized membrane protein YgdD (TMEM256/DUF423 family)